MSGLKGVKKSTRGRVKKWPPGRVPKSCIESAETILRAHDNPSYRFTKGGLGSSSKRKPMYLHLKKRGLAIRVNVSDNDSNTTFRETDKASSYLEDNYELENLSYGQGVSFIRVVGAGDGYDMHFMALIVKTVDGCVFSDVSEPDDWNETTLTLLKKNKTPPIKTVRELRNHVGDPYTDSAKYACGVITLSETVP